MSDKTIDTSHVDITEKYKTETYNLIVEHNIIEKGYVSLRKADILADKAKEYLNERFSDILEKLKHVNVKPFHNQNKKYVSATDHSDIVTISIVAFAVIVFLILVISKVSFIKFSIIFGGLVLFLELVRRGFVYRAKKYAERYPMTAYEYVFNNIEHCIDYYVREFKRNINVNTDAMESNPYKAIDKFYNSITTDFRYYLDIMYSTYLRDKEE